MRFAMNFYMGNVAFDVRPEIEVSRILNDVANSVRVLGRTEGAVVDFNGHLIGEWEIIVDSADSESRAGSVSDTADPDPDATDPDATDPDFKPEPEPVVQITVSVRSCRDCRHMDHSGSYTIGGARLICGHPDASAERVSKEQFWVEYPQYRIDPLAKDGTWEWKHHWIHRVLDTDGKSNTLITNIPDWCPLKHGARY